MGAEGESSSRNAGGGSGNGSNSTGLAYTGTNASDLVLPGGILLFLGVILLIAARRRGVHQG